MAAEPPDDRDATEVIRALAPAILRYLRSVLRDEDDVADAFQLWSEHVWRGLPGYRGEASLQTWGTRLARNAVLNLRNEAWRRRGRRFETGEASRIAEELRTRSFVRVERQRTALEEIREELEVDERSLLHFRVDRALSWKEIGELLEEDPNTCAKRYERLKERIARLARARGLL